MRIGRQEVGETGVFEGSYEASQSCTISHRILEQLKLAFSPKLNVNFIFGE